MPFLKYFIACCTSATIFASSVVVFNDSPYKLNASIMSATGEEMGSVMIQPQHSMRWVDTQGMARPQSQTPYTVIFSCDDGGEYGVATNVPAGSTITAQSATGRKFCRPHKKDDGDTPSQPGQWQGVDSY